LPSLAQLCWWLIISLLNLPLESQSFGSHWRDFRFTYLCHAQEAPRDQCFIGPWNLPQLWCI
jgi:hypothetical protein